MEVNLTKLSRVTHIAFGDESYWNKGRYRGLGLLTLKKDLLEKIRSELLIILSESNVTEFKWKKLKGARERFAALKMCEFTINTALSGVLRADVLTWDTGDSRHQVRNRDDVANLQRMYYHLFKNVLRERWPDGSVWQLHPDEHTQMDWPNVQNFLGNVETSVEFRRDLFSDGKFQTLIKREFKIEKICPVTSHEEPLVQLADLFVGLGVFSRKNYNLFRSWEKRKSLQRSIFPEENEHTNFSGSEVERFLVLYEFNKLCKNKKLGVSLETNQGLRTYKPENPINFWWYEPQHPADKAPTKK